VIRTLDDFYIQPRHYVRHGAAKQEVLIAAIGVEFDQERFHSSLRSLGSADGCGYTARDCYSSTSPPLPNQATLYLLQITHRIHFFPADTQDSPIKRV
jgi:hypothetical protein